LVQSIIVGTWNAIKNVINGAINIIMGVVTIFSALFTGNWSALWDGIKQVLMGALELAWGLVNLYFIGRLLGPLRSFGSLAGGIIRGVWNFIKGLFMSGVNGIRTLVTTYFNFYRTVISGVMNGVMTIIRTTWNVIRSVFTGALNLIRTIVTNVFNVVRAVITAAMNTVRTIISTVWNAVKSVVTSAVNGIRTIISNVFNALKNVVSTAMNNVKSAIETGWEAAKSFLSSISLKSIGKNIIEGLVSGITNAMGLVKDAVSGLADMVPEWLKKKMGIHSPARVMIPLGGYAIEGVAVGMQDQMKLVDRASRDIAMTIQQPVAGITPETSSSTTTTNNSSNRTINFNPTIHVDGGGSGDGGDVRQQVRDAMDEAFAHLLDLYDPEVAY
jgi:phage-related protein